MANRIITADVRGEYIKLSSRVAGAAGAYNAVSLELTFDAAWDGTTKKLYFCDADGTNAVFILLTANLLKPGSGEVYVVPIPAEPLAVAGKLTLNIRGVETGAADTAERVMVAAETQMDVLAASMPENEDAPVEPTPTQAEQLQAEIDEIKSDIVDAAKAADAVQVATDAAQSATSAKEAAQAAKTAAEAAETGALAAKTASEAAEASANQARLMAQAHSADAAISEANAKAWAEGGELQGMSTSMEGEVVPGAKYYSEAAAASATEAESAAQSAVSAKTSAESSATASASSASAAASSALSASGSATVASGKASDAAASASAAALSAAEASGYVSSAEAAAASAASALTDAQVAKAGAESAKSGAERARDASASSATAAAGSATAAAQSADAAGAAQADAERAASAAEVSKTAAEGYTAEAKAAKNDATAAKTAAEAAKDAIDNMSVEATTLPAGSNATVEKTVDATGAVKLTYGIPQGSQGPEGPPGPQGPAGSGSGDMLASTYDPQGKAQDVFAYVDDKADKAVPSAANNVALLDAEGNLADSGKSIDSLGGIPVVNTEGTGAAYTATVPGITSLTRGACFIMVPHAQSTSKTPTLDVNNLGAKEIRRAQSVASNYMAGGKSESWLGTYSPVLVIFSGNYWVVQNLTQPFATDLQGSVSIVNGGTGADNANSARANLGITPANIGALPLAGGTMTGALTAAADTTPTTAKVRNTSLNASEVTPTQNGAIAWTYA